MQIQYCPISGQLKETTCHGLWLTDQRELTFFFKVVGGSWGLVGASVEGWGSLLYLHSPHVMSGPTHRQHVTRANKHALKLKDVSSKSLKA